MAISNGVITTIIDYLYVSGINHFNKIKSDMHVLTSDTSDHLPIMIHIEQKEKKIMIKITFKARDMTGDSIKHTNNS